MKRVAVFVDAGYLFAQGSTCLTGTNKSREHLKLNETEAIAALKSVALTKAGNAELLRIYWYDGAAGYAGPSLQQSALASLDDVKLRLGFINSHGQQKGVDSLIVTDLIDLARNNAISDAVLLAGDEDVRVGVQVAQNYGVRVHLIGIDPCRGSQSVQLIQEADTTTEWPIGVVEAFLSEKLSSATNSPTLENTGTVPPADISKVAEEIAQSLDPSEITDLKAHWKSSGSIPREFDGKLLARIRAALGRDLNTDEKRQARLTFRNTVKDHM